MARGNRGISGRQQAEIRQRQDDVGVLRHGFRKPMQLTDSEDALPGG